MSIPVISCDELSIGYGSSLVRSGLNFSAHQGELTCLLGANGCGKSTLFKTLTGDLAPLSGSLNPPDYFGSKISARERAKFMATVLTHRQFPDYLNVTQFVMSGRYPHLGPWSSPKEDDYRVVKESLELVEGQHLSKRWVQQLSDGEKQRVVLAKALAQESKVLVLDEPTAFLDVPHKALTFSALRRWAQQQRAHVILSTHDVEFALAYSDHLWLMGADFEVMGAPEDLLQAGHLNRVFQHRDLKFDLDGRINIHPGPCVFLNLKAEEPYRALALKAILREGFGHALDAQVSLEHVPDANAPWVLLVKDERSEHIHLHGVCQRLRSINMSDVVSHEATTK